MKHAVALASLLILGWAMAGWAQEQDKRDFSASRGLGLGGRFSPPVPIASNLDPALGSAITLQYWASNQIGLELGGWASAFYTKDSARSFTSVSGGLLLKFFDTIALDVYAVGRVISLQIVKKYELLPQPASLFDNTVWPSQESHTSTLAVEAAAGIEWSWSPQVTTNFELGITYAQMLEKPPQPEPTPQTSLSPPNPDVPSSSFGVMLHLSVNFYLLRMGKRTAAY
jgi:hypothetical protein